MASYFRARDELEPVSREELLDRVRAGTATALDVRPEDEFSGGHIPGAINIPLAQLERRLGELPPDIEVVAYCRGPEHLALRELAGTDPTTGSPGRIIIDAITVGRSPSGGAEIRSAPLDIRRIGAVTTADAVVAQQPDVAGPRDGVIGDLWDAVGIAQTTRPQTSQDLFEPVWLKADQIEVKTAEFEAATSGKEILRKTANHKVGGRRSRIEPVQTTAYRIGPLNDRGRLQSPRRS